MGGSDNGSLVCGFAIFSHTHGTPPMEASSSSPLEHFKAGVLCRQKGNNALAIGAFERALYLSSPNSSSLPLSPPPSPTPSPSPSAGPPLFEKEFACLYNLASCYSDAKAFPRAIALLDVLLFRIAAVHSVPLKILNVDLQPPSPSDLDKAKVDFAALSSLHRPSIFSLSDDLMLPTLSFLKSSDFDILLAAMSLVASLHLLAKTPLKTLYYVLLTLPLQERNCSPPQDYYNVNVAMRQVGLMSEAIAWSWSCIDFFVQQKVASSKPQSQSPLLAVSPTSKPPTPPPTPVASSTG